MAEVRPRRIEILAIGDELLDGRVADTNTLRLAAALSPFGLALAERVSVRDDAEEIVRAARAAIDRGAELCVVSGGLGPTSDDITAEALARVATVPLVRDAEQARAIKQLLRRRGRPITDNQLKQADRPESAIFIANPVGTAPGFALTIDGCRFVALPGVPREFDAMLEAVVKPFAAAGPARQLRFFKCFGLSEAEVDRRLAELAKLTPSVHVGYRATFPEVHVSLSATAAAQAELESAAGIVRIQLGDHVFTERQEESLAAVVLERLRERGESLATAESCTGGLVASLITDIPGSSDVFIGGVTAYSYVTKTDLLGVPNEVLKREGAVSEATVLAMAHGARQRFGTAWAVSVSGIAGPGGGTPDKPVGTVHVAVVGPKSENARRLQLPFDRLGNKSMSAHAALDTLRREILDHGEEKKTATWP